jgi:hypothetical protein
MKKNSKYSRVAILSAFKKLYPNYKVELVDKSWDKENKENLEIRVTSEYSKIPLNFGVFLKVGRIFGTLNFDFDQEHEYGEHRYSSWTVDTWDRYEHSFKVAVKNLGQGLDIGAPDMEELQGEDVENEMA